MSPLCAVKILGRISQRFIPKRQICEKGYFDRYVLVFWVSCSFFGTGLVSILLYRLFELGTGQRKEEKREKNKFRIKPINGQTLIFDFLWFSFDFGSTSPCIGSLFVYVTAGMVPLSLGWRGVTPLLPIMPSIGVTPIRGGVKDGEGWPLSSSGAHSARNALPNSFLT